MKATRKRRDPEPTELERRILDLERTVQLLDEARSHYADQYDFAPFGCLTLDDRGCVLELNVTAAKLLGRERAFIVGMPLLPYVEREHVRAFVQHLRQCRRTREKVVSEVVVAPRRGEARLVELLSVPVLDATQGKTIYRTALLDITERRRAERALRQSEERFSTAFRASPSPIAITALADGRFIDANASFCRLVGRPHGEIVGRTSAELGDIADDPARAEWASAARMGRAPRNVATRMRTRTGEFRDVLVSAEIIALEGEECLLAIGQDVTELRQLQSEVLEIGEREQARIGEDLHDGVCQNLVGIAYLADALARDIGNTDPGGASKVREFSALLRESVEDVRRLAAGLFPVKLERYGLAWALQELARETCEHFGARCRFEMPRPLSFPDQTVSIHLYRIAQEAVRNAVHHGHARNIALELASDDGTVRLRIRDDGVGMPPRRKRNGGLGLHTMHYRAQMLGGSLEIASAPKRGTIVTCAIPDTGVECADGEGSGQEADFPR